MIDVCVGKPFKDLVCDLWAQWMLEQCERRGTTPAGNLRHASPTECNSWVTQAWAALSTSGVKRKAAELGMTADAGPPVQGYKERCFEDEEPKGDEEESGDEELCRDLMKAEEEAQSL